MLLLLARHCLRPENSRRARIALNSAGIATGYRIAGSIAQPSINSLYIPTNQTLNGSPVYANGDSTQFLYWNVTGQWVIGDVLYSNQGMFFYKWVWVFCASHLCRGCRVVSVCQSVILSPCHPVTLSSSQSLSLSFPPSLACSPSLPRN